MSYLGRTRPPKGLRRKIHPERSPDVEAGFDKERPRPTSKPLPLIPADAVPDCGLQDAKAQHAQPPRELRSSRSSVFDLFSRPKAMLARGYSEQGMPAPSSTSLRERWPSRSNTPLPQLQERPVLSHIVSEPIIPTQRIFKKTPTYDCAIADDPSRLTGSWDPPALFQAYPQAIRHTILLAPASTSGSVTKGRKNQVRRKPPTLDANHEADQDMDGWLNHLTSGRSWIRKIYVLVTSGYLLQYAGDGAYDRRPEKVLQLKSESAAFASDLIPGQHFVLQVMESTAEHMTSQPSFLSRMGIQSSSTKRAMNGILMVFDSAQDMNVWMMEIRNQIDILSGKKPQLGNLTDRASEADTRLPSHRFSIIRKSPSPKPSFQLPEDDSSISSAFYTSGRSSTAVESVCDTTPSIRSSTVGDEPLMHLDSPYILTPQLLTPQLMFDESFGDFNAESLSWDKNISALRGEDPSLNGLSYKNPPASSFYRRRSLNTIALVNDEGFLVPGIATPTRLKRYSTSGRLREITPPKSPGQAVSQNTSPKKPPSSNSTNQELPKAASTSEKSNKSEIKRPLQSNPVLRTIHERQLSENAESAIVRSEAKYSPRKTMLQFRLELPPNSRKRLSQMHTSTIEKPIKETPPVKAHQPNSKQPLCSPIATGTGNRSSIVELRTKRVPIPLRLPINVTVSETPAPARVQNTGKNAKSPALQRPQSLTVRNDPAPFLSSGHGTNAERSETRNSGLYNSNRLSEFNYLFAGLPAEPNEKSVNPKPYDSEAGSLTITQPFTSSTRTSMTLTPTISSTRTSVLLGPPSPSPHNSVILMPRIPSPRVPPASPLLEPRPVSRITELESPVCPNSFLTVPEPIIGSTARPSSTLEHRGPARVKILSGPSGLPPMQPPPTIPLPSVPAALDTTRAG